MIPDKIYISTVTLSSNEPGEQHLLPDWHLRPSPKIANIEYIRKDVLLEWLGNKIKIPDVSFINGLTYLAYKDVIDKLNSL